MSIPSLLPPQTDPRALSRQYETILLGIKRLFDKEVEAVKVATDEGFEVVSTGPSSHHINGAIVGIYDYEFRASFSPFRILGNVVTGWHLYNGPDCITPKAQPYPSRLFRLCDQVKRVNDSLASLSE